MTRKIADLCRENNLNFQDLVEKCGLDESKVKAIFLGRWTPSPKERDAIAGVFGLPKEELSWGHKTPIQHIYGHGPG